MINITWTHTRQTPRNGAEERFTVTDLRFN